MPRKNIYIRDDDLALFEEAIEKLGKDKEAIGTIIIDALKERLSQLGKLEEEAFKLQMLYILGSLKFPPIKELAESRLDELPKKVSAKAYKKAYFSYLGNEEHFEVINESDFVSNWASKFIWDGIEGLIENQEKWFKEGKKYIEEGKKRHEKGKTILDEDILENE